MGSCLSDVSWDWSFPAELESRRVLVILAILAILIRTCVLFVCLRVLRLGFGLAARVM